jgi:hypothetical protein
MKKAIRALLLAGGMLFIGCDCEEGGKTYEHGESWTRADGCNTCTCDNGAISCTLIVCIDEYTDASVEDGEGS